MTLDLDIHVSNLQSLMLSLLFLYYVVVNLSWLEDNGANQTIVGLYCLMRSTVYIKLKTKGIEDNNRIEKNGIRLN